METICFSVAFGVLSFCGYSQLSLQIAEARIWSNIEQGLPRYQGVDVEYKLTYGGILSNSESVKALVLPEYPEARDISILQEADLTILLFKIPGSIHYLKVEDFAPLLQESRHGYYEAQ